MPVRSIGSRTAAYKGVAVPLTLPQSNIRRKRGKMFIIGDAGGRVLYSSDGRQWKQAAAIAGATAIGRVMYSNGRVVVLESGGGAHYESYDLREPWTQIAYNSTSFFLSGDYFLTPSQIRLRDNSAVKAYGFTSDSFVRENGEVILSDGLVAAYRMIVPGQLNKFSDAAISSVAGEGYSFGQNYIYCNNNTALHRRRRSDWSSPGNITLGFLSGASGGSFSHPLAVGNGVAVVTGSLGEVAVFTGNADAIAYSGSVGFTAGSVGTVYWNGEVFLALGTAGVGGISSDGINWTAISTGFASDIHSCEVSDIHFA